MKRAKSWKILIGIGLVFLTATCAPKRTQTQFSKNKEAEAGQTYTPDQMRAALGSDRYDALITGIGADNLNSLVYGIGLSNMTTLINSITGPGKLVSLMSDGPNSKKMTSIEVLDLLLKVDMYCQKAQFISNTSMTSDTIVKMAAMINNVSIAGMEGIKNIMHGMQDQISDRNLTTMPNKISRLGQLIAGLKESNGTMQVLIDDLTAPNCSVPGYSLPATCAGAGGVWSATRQFSDVGTAKLIRLVNATLDIVDLIDVINNTQSLSNITGVMAGLTQNVYCQNKPWYLTSATCSSGGGVWINTKCSLGASYEDRASCEGATPTPGVWTTDGIENMTRIINELDRVCANTSKTNAMDCFAASSTWRTKAHKLPYIVNNITNVPNMFVIVNGLSNDGKRPQWPVGGATVPLPVGLGLPAPYAGDLGNVFDGVDSMVATMNKLYIASDADSFGTNGTLRLAYMVNNLDTTPVYGNDSDFDTGTSCTTGQFDNRLNWAFSNNQTVTGSPWWGGSFASGGGTLGTHYQAGTCGLKNDNTAATVFTQTQSAELIANITTPGTMSFRYRLALNIGDTVRFLVDDAVVNTYTSANNSASFTNQNYAATSGVHRFRWDIQRVLNSTGQVFLDTVVLPGDKGAARTAAEKTFIMMNNLYINSSLTNVADILSNVTATNTPAGCWTADPITCTPSWNNGLDTLIQTVNRVEYPASIATIPRLAITVNQISNLQIMYDILNSMPSQAATNQLVALMDFVQTPANLPALINALTGSAGVRIGDILKTLTAAGTVNMLRVLANTPAGAAISDTAILINGVPNTVRVGEILNELKLSGNVYDTKSQSGVTISTTSPAVVTWTGHGLIQNARVSFSTTGKLPTGLFSGRVYYACPLTALPAAMDANQFRLSTDLTCTALQNATVAGSGTHTGMAGDETAFSSPVGGAKLAQFFNAVNAKGSGSANTCNVNDTEDDFCIKNHLVRLVNDIATSSSGSNTVAEIVSNLRPNAGPGGNTGVTRMVDVLFDMKNQTSGSNYTDPLSNSTAEDFGRLTAFIKDMTGGNAGLNTARMVNEVQLTYMNARVTFLLKSINRMRYLSRLLSEMTSVDLMLQLLNDPSTNINTIDSLVDTHGNGTYGVAATGSYAGAIYGVTPSGTNCTTSDCDVNATDQLGRLIQLINNIFAIGNTLYLINNTQDTTYIPYLVNNVTRVKYLTDIVNNLTNVDLMVKVINGADACSRYVVGVNDTAATDTEAICTGGSVGGVWFGVGRCTNFPLQTTRLAHTTAPASTGCLAQGGGTGVWNGADRVRLRDLLNGLGTSLLKGSGSKDTGEMDTLWDVMNRLGFNGAVARTSGQQVRVVRLVNAVEFCGLKPQYDKYIQYGTTCVDGAGTPRPLNFQFKEACAAAGAGYNWQAKASTTAWVTPSTIFNDCRTIDSAGVYNTAYTLPTATVTSGGYYNNGDVFDARPRLLQAMLNVNDGVAFSYIVGDVEDTQKTIDMMNGVRRVGAVTKLVNWLPGAVTAALVNTTHSAAVNRALVYMANNLDDDETETAKAFASMIHYGTKIVATGQEGTAPACLEFTGLGPRRLASVLNLEAGPYIEGLISGLGWQLSIAAMNCGWARDSDENAVGACAANAYSDSANSGMLKNVGGSYNGNPKPTAQQCIRHREALTDGATTYRYGNYTWGTNQGIRQDNCQSIMPNTSGGNAVITTLQDDTDKVIWNGLFLLGIGVGDGIGSDGCADNTCEDMWAVLKGQGGGIIGWVMGASDSMVGFPSPRGYNNTGNRPDGTSGTTYCSNNSNNTNNWQCIRCGLANGDLSSNSSCSNGTATSYGRYWGTFCSGASATGTGAAAAQSCITNGGTWKTLKNYQGSTCNLDPSAGASARVGP